jgi:hypothetical protein
MLSIDFASFYDSDIGFWKLYDIFIYGINNYSVQVTICDMYVVRKFHMGREGLLTPYMSY